MIDQIDRSFERLLRWIYPAVLFLVLLGVSRPGDFDTLAEVKWPWGLAIVGLVAGAVAYLLQAYVVNQLVVSQVSHYCRWERNVYEVPRFRFLIGLANYADRWARVTHQRWGTKLERLHSYLNYAWATYHAAMLTAWLTLIFFLLKVEGSMFASVEWWVVVIPAVLLLVGAIWQYVWLARIQPTLCSNKSNT